MVSVLYINLDRDADRRRAFEAAAIAKGLQVERLAAATPSTMGPTISARFRRDTRLLPGEIGCFASHIAAWQIIANAEDRWHIVCEDDAVLRIEPDDLAHILALSVVPRPFVQLCGQIKSSALRIGRAGDCRLVRPLFTIMNSTAYALRPTTAQTLLSGAFDIGIPVDGFLRKFGRVHLDMLAVAPAPFGTQSFGSTIVSTGRRGIRSKVPFRGSRFRLGDELRFVAKFGALPFVRVFSAYLVMKTRRIKTDISGHFEV